MNKVIDWIKSHPKWTAGLVVIFVLLVWVLNRGTASSGANNASTASGPSDAVQAAAITAQAQVQAAQIAGNAQTAQVNANADVSKAYIASQVDITRLNDIALIEQFRYATQAQIADDIANVTINAPQTQKSSGGFKLGPISIGGGSKTVVADVSGSVAGLTQLIAANNNYVNPLGGTGLSGTGASGANN